MISIQVRKDLLLRTLYTEDAEELFSVVNQHRQHLRPWLNWIDSNTTLDHTIRFIQLTLQQQENQEAFVLGIFLNDKIIGEVGMNNWNHTLKKAQIGYWLTADHEGKGILNECLCKFLDFLFDSVGLNKIEIQFIPQNQRSAKVAERLGFKVEGLLRQSYLRNGMFEDLVVTGLLKKEWHDMKRPAS